jgi:hypothetical protein
VKLQFSGHETFAFRHGWLKKVFDAISKSTISSDQSVFKAEDAIADFGVGKNMVNSMAHWAVASRVISKNKLKVTTLGEAIFTDGGFDPFLDDIGTLWLIHWNIVSDVIPSTTWYFAFHKFSGVTFDKPRLVAAIQDYRTEMEDTKTAQNTISRDVDCFVSTFVMKKNKSGELGEDSLECPLVELSLISETENKGLYEFSIGPKASLPTLIFLHALDEFFDGAEGSSLTLENITYGSGSPGKAFKLDENSVAEYLIEISEASDNDYTWIDTAGVRTLQYKDTGKDIDYLKKYFDQAKAARKAA